MKIIQLTPFFYPVIGGVEVQVMEISKKLIEMGHEVRVLTSNSSRNHSKVLTHEEIVDGVPVKRCNSLFSFSKFYPVVPGIFFELLKADFDLIHVHGFRKLEVYMALLVAKIRRKKIVVTTHNPFTANVRSKLLSLFVWFHDLIFGKFFTKFLDAVIVLVPSEIPILNKKFHVPSTRIHVIPNGINDLFFQDIDLNKELFVSEIANGNNNIKKILNKHWQKSVLSICRFNEVKGLQNLQLAVSQNPNVLFLFVGGDDGYLPKLKDIYKNCENVLIIERYVSREIVHKLMRISDLFVLPSLHEPFGLTPIEAAASGLPVLATNIGGPIETLGADYNEFLNPQDENLWSNKIKDLLLNENKLIEIAKRGKLIADKYRWEKVISMLTNLYKQIL